MAIKGPMKSPVKSPMKKTGRPKRKVGRPKNGKRPFKVRLTPAARGAAGKRGLQMGADFSAYVESLIRRDNPGVFPEARLLGAVS